VEIVIEPMRSSCMAFLLLIRGSPLENASFFSDQTKVLEFSRPASTWEVNMFTDIISVLHGT
jgi:hypothetical protein